MREGENMAKLEIFVVRVEGDAAAISEAFEMVRRQSGQASLPVKGAPVPPVIPARVSGAREESRNDEPRTGKKTGILRAPARKTRDNDKQGQETGAASSPKLGSMQDKALAFIRDSHYGVTSDEIHSHLQCATVQSAYQICLELQKKRLVERTAQGAWKLLNA
jgi:hypothetical protein